MSKKWIASFVAASVLAAALAGCGGQKQQPPAGGGAAQQGVKVTVWSHLTQPEVDEINKLAQDWAKNTGNTVEVLADQTGFQEYAAAAQAGAGPDIMYGLPHDNFGTFQKAGMLDPVPAGVINNADYEQVGLDAVSYEGKLFGVPISMESIALYYNKAMVPNAPQNWDEFIAAAKDKGFVFDVKNFYHAFGFIGGSGGYVFKNVGGGLDPKDVGLANEGAKAGLKLLDDFVNTHKLMPVDINGDMAKANFVGGKAAFYLSGPWDIQAAKDANIDFGVMPMPNLPSGKPFTPFVGVQGAFVASGSAAKTQAWDLVKYLQENSPKVLFKTGNRIPVQKKYAEDPDVKANVPLAGFAASAANGMPMPNIPAMSVVWEHAGKMIDLVVTKQASVDQAAADAVKGINDAVAAMK